VNEPSNPAPPPGREDRLAAKLRENLRRRKAQARALEAAGHPEGDDESPAALSKPGPSR